MTIYFKNGMIKEVTPEVGEIIKKRVNEGCGQFQSFSDQNGELQFIINLQEIVYID